jgi:hypothetical protein
MLVLHFHRGATDSEEIRARQGLDAAASSDADRRAGFPPVVRESPVKEE